jgi:tetratricopeptide (TPR) repeat protein
LRALSKFSRRIRSCPQTTLASPGYYERLGRYQEAIDSYLEAIRLGDDSGDAQLLLAGAYARGGQRAKALAILKRFETGELYSSPFGLAMLHLALGDKERTYALLEEAYAMHDQQLIWLRSEPGFDSIRSEPRFQDLKDASAFSPL